LHIDHLDRRHLVEHRPRCQARRQRSQPLLQRDLQAVRQERDKDVGFNALIALVVDGADRNTGRTAAATP